ncbi:hypothetical protein AGMMS49543_19150 [Betaproteobacteria bacterium]|nr:hypothetical protein AGMMS49543_19150 [Betaproteobacteria bacterium]GHU22323.1 hypothetical protein AGMMS50243_21670 [Betaproteobacteria bacterium]
MKKKFLAVNVALALGAMVVGSAAYAAVANTTLAAKPVTAAPVTGAQSVALPGNVVVSESYVGIINVVPYYSVQGGNTVALSITNNDQKNGKVVKVRFRGATWSDDVLDFQVFLSPGDIWTAALTNEGGVAKLNPTGDTTVTRPLIPAGGVPFQADLRVAGEPGNTLEGYVEIITLADIPPTLNGKNNGAAAEFGGGLDDTVIGGSGSADEVHTNPLYTVTKHSAAGAAPLAYTNDAVYKATIDALVQDSYWKYPNAGATVDDATSIHLYQTDDPAFTTPQPQGAVYDGKSQFGADKNHVTDDWLQFPTNGISSYVTVINVQDRKAYTLQATALKNAPVLEGLNDADDAAAAGLYTTAAVQNGGAYGASATDYHGAIKAYFEQNPVTVTWAGLGEKITADKIFGDTGGAFGVTGIVAYAGLELNELDLPDLSTPTTAAVAAVIPSTGVSAGVLRPVAGAHYPGGAAAAQRDLVAAALQAQGFGFEYVTDLGLNASTDIVVNQPVRRYYYWYAAASATNYHREFSAPSGYWNVFGESNTPYASLAGASNSIKVGGYSFTGREEEAVVAPSGGSSFSPAPSVPQLPQLLIGEVSVIAVNGVTGQPSEALGAKLTKNVATVGGGYRNGWGYLTTTTEAVVGKPTAAELTAAGDNLGFAPATGGQAHLLLKNRTWLPYIAYSAINVYSPASGAVYGTTLPVRVNK